MSAGPVAEREAAARLRSFDLVALQPHLPLRFPSTAPQDLPEHFRTRSWYRYPGWAGLTERGALEHSSPLYIALHLIDFSPLRAELVQLLGLQVNGRGGTPFDPVSLFLCALLRWETHRGWDKVAQLLGSAEGACWRRLCGFAPDDTPASSTLRIFFRHLRATFTRDLCPRFIALLQQAGLLPPHTPHAATPARDGLPLATDGMLHTAHSTLRCSRVTATCYQPTTAEHPRPCLAREAGQEGCACDTERCAQQCCRSTPRDPEARFIHYSGRNQEGEEDPSRARDVYGYRSYAHLLVDDALHTYWVAYSSVHPATTDERVIFPTDFAHLRQRLPALPISELVADAALGYTPCLQAIYTARAIPVVDLRADPTDQDPAACVLRGYDADGQPLCAHGYPMTFNGLDYERLRATWACRQLCTRGAKPNRVDADCPFRDPQRPLGMVKHIQRAFTHPDGSTHARLARLYPYRGALWKQRYGCRRNATESRNSQLEHLGLKRIWSYGLPGATADIAFADLLINLRALGRLVQQATLLDP
jgi:hypothetical protein